MLSICEIDVIDGAIYCLPNVLHIPDTPHHRDELMAGHEVVYRLMLGHHTNAPIERWIVPNRLAEHRHGSTRCIGKTCHHAKQCGLAGAVWTKKSSDPRCHVERHIAHSDYAPEPA